MNLRREIQTDLVTIRQLARYQGPNDLLTSMKARGGNPGDELWLSSDEGFRQLLDEQRTTGKALLILNFVSKFAGERVLFNEGLLAMGVPNYCYVLYTRNSIQIRSP